jgi:glutamate/tyrosine decarboxylase-like PLP-dependent enzyme
VSTDRPVGNAGRVAPPAAPLTGSFRDMHGFDTSDDLFGERALAFSQTRMRLDADGVVLGHPVPRQELDARVGASITEGGLGSAEVLRIFTEVLEPACLSVDFPRYFAYVPAAPTEVSIIADMVVSACSIYAGTWLEGAGAVWAENQALAWLARLAGLPEGAGGCFVSGGTAGNLSALVAARFAAASATGRSPAGAWALVAGESAHTSTRTTASVMGVELITVPGRKLTGEALRPVLEAHRDRVFAVAATGGSTNLGLVDDLASVAEVCHDAGVWMHVDAAYGGAALAAPSVRWRFDGIERADSFIVDPHKWLFAPFDACALLYRHPEVARAAHAQHASYLDLDTEIAGPEDWNPSDYAIHLSRRARGLPFWFSVASYGTRAYGDAIEACLAVVAAGADIIRASDHLELVCEPELSVIAFRRIGWTPHQYGAWSRHMLDTGTALVVPSACDGEAMLRICIVNPCTTVDDVRLVLDSLRD